MNKEGQPVSPEPEDVEAINRATEFLAEEAPHLARVFDMGNLQIKVGKGWSTDPRTGQVTVDPSYFAERGYKPDWTVYATMHEIVAHLREVKWKPGLTRQVNAFIEQGKAQSIFHNAFADIAGNNAIHARLPRMAATARDLYQNKLFRDDPTPQDDPDEKREHYKDKPRHIQFLYKIIRDEMIPGSHTTVLPEVREAIEGLRDYEGSGEDAIKYSTSVVNERGQEQTPEARYGLWQKVIYPVYEQLLEQDKEDPHFSNEGKEDNSEGDESQTDDKGSDDGQFSEYYQDYDENRHPEPITKEMESNLKKYVEKQTQEDAHRKQQSQQAGEKMRDKQLRQETGHGLSELKAYDEELMRWQPEIDALRDIYKGIIDQRVTMRRGLARQAKAEGVLLDPNRLGQTVVDIKSGVREPAAFLDYAQRLRSFETTGNVDYYFVADVSSSMMGPKAAAAAASTLIFLEGLSAMQAEAEREEMDNDLALGLMVRSAVYTFGSTARCIKPLSSSLTTKERIDAYQAVASPVGITADYLALQAIAREDRDDFERKCVIIVMTDGKSDKPDEAKSALQTLRQRPNTYAYGIGIGDSSDTSIYEPNAYQISDPAELPDTMKRLISETIL